MAAVPFTESKRRASAMRMRRFMQAQARMAFSDVAMLDHSALVVWTKAQMRGLRSVIKRLGMV